MMEYQESDWKISIEEISMATYKLQAVDRSGRSFEMIGPDIEKLRECFKMYVIQVK